MRKIYLLLLISFFAASSSGLKAQLLGNDVTILNLPLSNQDRPDMDAAFNGWLYNAFTSSNGLAIRMSRDHGSTWTTIDSYNPLGIVYPFVKLVVTGTDTNNLILYVASVNEGIIGNTSNLYIDQYDGRTGGYIGTTYNKSFTGFPIYGVDIATDYKYPGVGASPYSVAFAYAIHGAKDSIILDESIDGGANWTIHDIADTTSLFYRNVSLCYGRSASGSNGRYFLAWDRYDSLAAATGHIFTSHTTPTITSSFITPVCVDSFDATSIGYARRPVISVAANNDNNDSASTTAVILFDRAPGGDTTNFDIVGSYNSRAHFTNFWNPLNLEVDGNNTNSPSICFDPIVDSFYVTYFDSTNKRQPYVQYGFNLTPATTATFVSINYVDVPTFLSNPHPVVCDDPFFNQPAFSWSAPVINGVVYFDAPYRFGPGPLAIKTSAITATNVSTKNRIDWSTASEDAGTVFTIERSADGKNFKAIGTTRGQGTASNYTYWDDAPFIGMNYYRLQAANPANELTYTNVVSAFVKGGGTFTVQAYPNPVLSTVAIFVSGQQGANSNITITDLTGKVLQQQSLTGTQTSLDMSSFSPGIYLIKYADDTNTQVIRVSKN